jgi:hypothetical protein
MTTMLEEKLARLRAHRHNVYRYRRLLRTKLTDLERGYILRRLEQEEQALAALSEGESHAAMHPPVPVQPPIFAGLEHV